MGSVTHPEPGSDTVELARIVFGGEFVDANTVIVQLDQRELAARLGRDHARRRPLGAEANQAVMMTPFILAGAMSPVRWRPLRADARGVLAGMAYVQLVRPGAPVVLGSFASSMSMQSGAPTFGTPEPALVLYVMAALAQSTRRPVPGPAARSPRRRWPMRRPPSSRRIRCSPRCRGVNFVLHAAGWLEGGLDGVREFVLDADQLGMWHAFAPGVDLSENGQAMDAFLTNERGTISSATRTLCELRAGLLPLVGRRQLELRAVGERRCPRRGDPRERDLEEHARRVRGTADRRGGRRGAPRMDRPPQGVLPDASE